ncbi:cupin domain-containing protein [Paenibacillus sp. UMB4589-SE434]|uniref:cupin domain-containing protein n=1 Tax=Paenibacillus sp. UMB4589-SE434 TaxID=3046314 RepID=UPI00254FC0B6|nr:cupin domain-containing protein [Paenibacillus sp. UMB4589-SE434]MDK8180060.1 cupin domain-containing protein [Paenibacillus sp. UMB4589-SE434]
MHHHLGHHYHWHNPVPSNWNNNYQGHYPQYCYRYNNDSNPYGKIILRDYGQCPLVVNIDQAAKQNNTYRTALWTGKHFQVTLMSINVGEDIGLEVHPTTDQFIRVEEGQGLVQMGDRKDNLDFQVMAYEDYAIMIPAGKWHNITNTGHIPLKIYVIYAPPEHPYGTVHETKAVAMSAEG